jgi:hypothetical protein
VNSVTEKKPKIDPATCSHPLLSRHIDKAAPKGGFTGNWVCQRCKQEFCHLTPAVLPTTVWHQTGNDTNYTTTIPLNWTGDVIQ